MDIFTCWVKISADNNLKKFSYTGICQKKNRFRYFMPIFSSGDSLHEMSKPSFRKKISGPSCSKRR